MDLLDEVVPGSEAVPRGRVGTEDGEYIIEWSPVGVPNGISDGQEDWRNQGLLLFSDLSRQLGKGGSRMRARS